MSIDDVSGNGSEDPGMFADMLLVKRDLAKLEAADRKILERIHELSLQSARCLAGIETVIGRIDIIDEMLAKLAGKKRSKR